MQRDLESYLWDIQTSIKMIQTFVGTSTFEAYEEDDLLRSGVERKFMIIGEAMKQMAHHFPAEAAWTLDYKGFAGFRDVLIHQYERVNNVLVWDIIHVKLPILNDKVTNRLAELDY